VGADLRAANDVVSAISGGCPKLQNRKNAYGKNRKLLIEFFNVNPKQKEK
jgi:hypothetical protein